VTYWILRSAFWDDAGIWVDEDVWIDYEYTPSNQIVSSGFSLDSHDMYVLRLGDDETLIYDLETDSWSSWDSPGRNTWRATGSLNWVGILGSGEANVPQTNLICGDDTFGVLWALDPTTGVDDGPFAGMPVRPFTRTVTGGLPMRGRASPRNNSVTLTVSIMDTSAVDATLQLRISDDNGVTYKNCGAVRAPTSTNFSEVRWRSLGLIRAPSRIYEFSDTGAVVRIDGADTRLTEETE
jgi:hypothetical protein